jgi:5-methylcytosine-specific restriction endonuclease McrA
MALLNWLMGRVGRSIRPGHLATMPYRKYLSTPEWKATRAEALKRAGHRCQTCNTPATIENRLEVHHRTYARRGNELPQDLTVLCQACHILIHKHRRLVSE